MTENIKVLDHGYVRLIDHMGTDESIIEAARMSTGRGFEGWDAYKNCKKCGWQTTTMHGIEVVVGNSTSGPTPCADKSHDWEQKPGDKNLLDFLWRNKHATPFEMCELQIEVQAPIMVFREWHRHRTQSFNEFSARYSVMPNLHYAPVAMRFAAKTSSNKQEASVPNGDGTTEHFSELVGTEQNAVYEHYEAMLAAGVPKEVARINTPVSRYSKMRAKTDLRNWLGFLNLRMRPNAQWEIRQYANAVAGIIKSLWPRTYALFEEYDLYGVHLSRTEMKTIRKTMQDDGDLPWLEENIKGNAEEAKMSASQQAELLKKYNVGGEEIL